MDWGERSPCTLLLRVKESAATMEITTELPQNKHSCRQYHSWEHTQGDPGQRMTEASSSMFAVALLPTDKLWHQLSCSSAPNKQKNVVHRHNRVLLSHKEEKMPSAGKCMELETQQERLHSLSNDP